MTAALTTLSRRTVLPEGLETRAASAPRQNRLFETFELFLLCHRMALHTEPGRTPPRWMLDELGVRPQD